MMLDFGVDPRSLDSMSLGQIDGMMSSLEQRRGKVPAPSEKDRADSMEAFAMFVRDDPNVSIH